MKQPKESFLGGGGGGEYDDVNISVMSPFSENIIQKYLAVVSKGFKKDAPEMKVVFDPMYRLLQALIRDGIIKGYKKPEVEALLTLFFDRNIEKLAVDDYLGYDRKYNLAKLLIGINKDKKWSIIRITTTTDVTSPSPSPRMIPIFKKLIEELYTKKSEILNIAWEKKPKADPLLMVADIDTEASMFDVVWVGIDHYNERMTGTANDSWIRYYVVNFLAIISALIRDAINKKYNQTKARTNILKIIAGIVGENQPEENENRINRHIAILLSILYDSKILRKNVYDTIYYKPVFKNTKGEEDGDDDDDDDPRYEMHETPHGDYTAQDDDEEEEEEEDVDVDKAREDEVYAFIWLLLKEYEKANKGTFQPDQKNSMANQTYNAFIKYGQDVVPPTDPKLSKKEKEKIRNWTDEAARSFGLTEEEKLEEGEEEEEEEEEEKEMNFHDYLASWDVYERVMMNQEWSMIPFELLRNPKKELLVGTAEQQQKQLSKKRRDYLTITLKEFEAALKKPKTVIPRYKSKIAGWNQTKIKNLASHAEKTIKRIVENRNQFNALALLPVPLSKTDQNIIKLEQNRRVGRINRMAKELAETKLAPVIALAAQELSYEKWNTPIMKRVAMAPFLEARFYGDPTKLPRKLLRRLKKEMKNIVKKEKKKKEKMNDPSPVRKEILDAQIAAVEAFAQMSKKDYARVMNVQVLPIFIRRMGDLFDAADTDVNRIIDNPNMPKKSREERMTNISIYIDRMRDLLLVISDPSYRFLGYDESKKDGINSDQAELIAKNFEKGILRLETWSALQKKNQGKSIVITPLPKETAWLGDVKEKISISPKVHVLIPRKKKITPKEEKEKEEEEEITAPPTSICDIMPTLANTVIPMARYETVRIQLRRRATANAGITSRIRSDSAFLITDPLRKAYTNNKNKAKWPINALAAAGLDAEIYRRVFGAQNQDMKPAFDFGEDPLKKNLLIQNQGKKQVYNVFSKFLKTALRPVALEASMGLLTFSGEYYIKDIVINVIKKEEFLAQDAMSYILKMYLNSTDFNRVAIADPNALYEARRRIKNAQKERKEILIQRGPKSTAKPPPRLVKIVPAWWLAAEVFSYTVPAAAIPLGTDESDAALRECGIEMVLVILNNGGVHWTLLAYPVRNKAKHRRLYHYDSYYEQTPESVSTFMGNADQADMFRMGLFSSKIAEKIVSVPQFPKGMECKQRGGWSCGYAALAFLDGIARRTEANPGRFLRDPTLEPLQAGDLPMGSKLGVTTDSILDAAKDWGQEQGSKTIWKWVQPSKPVDFLGYPDPVVPFKDLIKKKELETIVLFSDEDSQSRYSSRKVVTSLLSLEDNGFWN